MPASLEKFIDTVLHWLQVLGTNAVWIGLGMAVVFVLGCAVFALLRFLGLRWLLVQKHVFLEITPPASVSESPKAGQDLFTVLHDLGRQRARDRWLRRQVVFVPEEVSTEEGGIRYIMRVPASRAEVYERHLVSCLYGAQVKRVDDYLPDNPNYRDVRVMPFRQTGRSFFYPLRSLSSSKDGDPGAYLQGAMTKLKPDELVAFQLVVTPVNLREADILSRRLAYNQELVLNLGQDRSSIWRLLGGAVGKFFEIFIDTVSEIASGGASSASSNKESYRERDVRLKLKPARTLTPAQQRLTDSVHDKLYQSHFRVSIRALVKTGSKDRRKQREAGITGALNIFKTEKQSLKAKRDFPYNLRGRYRLYAFRKRLPALLDRNSCILSTSELADLFQFAQAGASKTDNMSKSLSKTLPPPLSLKGKPDFDVVLGRNHHNGTSTNIGLIARERRKHMYIIGSTDSGKTTMMQYAIVQDMYNGKGLAVVDPHGDMSKFVLEHVPKDRADDVVYFNPYDFAYPPGLNLLELQPDLHGNQLMYEKDKVTEAVVEIFRKIFSEDGTGGHRIEDTLRKAIHTAFEVEEATIFTVFDLLTDPKFRKPIVKKLQNQRLKNFWNNEYSRAGSYQQVSMTKGVTTKIGRFEFSATAKRIVEQPKSTIDFDGIMNSGKILICNLSKGLLTADTSELFGITILAKIQMAANRRILMDEKDRRPFHLYVDEFQNFATTSFTEIVSEARKFGLYITMAEQSTSQQDRQIVENILDNVGTIVCFKTGNPKDEDFMLPFFAPYVQKGEIKRLPAHNFYIDLGAVRSQEPTSGETLLVEEPGSKEMAEAVIQASRKRYAIKYQEPPKPDSKKDMPDSDKKKGGGAPKRKKKPKK